MASLLNVQRESVGLVQGDNYSLMAQFSLVPDSIVALYTESHSSRNVEVDENVTTTEKCWLASIIATIYHVCTPTGHSF